MKISKSDIFIVLCIGEAAGLLLLAVLNNLKLSLPQVEIIPFWFFPVLFPVFCLVWYYLAVFLSKRWTTFIEIGRFVLVGGLNFLVDLGILNLLIFLTGIAFGGLYSVFKAISFAAAVINSYFLNKFWTFKASDASDKSVKKIGKEFFTFIIISLIGLGLNNLMASLIVNWAGPQWGISENLWANIGAITASFIAMFWNFMGYKFIVFREK
ncbi:MAG: GtrA family protein [Parcubacteria group bacterium]|nr:GtrA family protein [Parcubacteria group bacterium]